MRVIMIFAFNSSLLVELFILATYCHIKFRVLRRILNGYSAHPDIISMIRLCLGCIRI
jgi:hypothetical protein